MKRWAAIPLAWLLVSFLLGTSAEAGAQERCPVPEGGSPALAAEDAGLRLSFLRDVMRDQSRRARTWTWAWSGIGYGLAAGQYALIPLVQPDKRVEQAFAGTASFYLPASIAVLPLRVRADDEELESLVAKASAPGGVMSPCLVVARGEELLAHSAADEAAHASLLQHAVTIVLSAGWTAVLWALFHDVAGIIVNGGGALLIGETQILTVPTGAVSYLRRYDRGELGAGSARAPSLVSRTLAPLGVAPGVSLVGTF